MNRTAEGVKTIDGHLPLWRRLPIVVRAVISGVAVAMAGILPWALLAEWNLIWATGVDAAFVGSVAGLVVLSVGTFWAYSALAHAARATQPMGAA